MSANPTDAAPPRLILRIDTQAGATVVHCSGRLMSADAGTLHDAVKSLLPDTKHIILDLTDLTQMDSFGLGTVVGLYVSARAAGCRLELINLSKRVRELLSITNLLSLFEACGDHGMRIP
jgi:anti-sigma B factor antagonist